MANEEPIVYFYDGDECWRGEELVPAARLAAISGDGILRLIDDATGVTLELRVTGEGRARFLARGKLGLAVRQVAAMRPILVEGGPELAALHLQDGAALVVGVGRADQFYPGSQAAEPTGDETMAVLSFEIEITGVSNAEGAASDIGDVLVSWIVDPKIRKGETHWWSAGSYPMAYVNSSGTIKAGGKVVSYPGKGRIYAKQFEVTTNDVVVEYEMTGKQLYFNGERYP